MPSDSLLAPFVRILGGITSGITPDTGASGGDPGSGRLEVVPTTIAAVYNSVAPPDIKVSDPIDCRNARFGALGFTLSSSATPTDFRFELEFTRLTVSAWTFHHVGDWAMLLFEDTETAGAGIAKEYGFPIEGNRLRFRCTATGTSGVNFFTLSNVICLLWT